MAKGAKVNDEESNGARQEWETPRLMFDNLNAEFNFTVDACAEAHNAKLPRFWTPHDNGLAQKWEGERVWCNPPYNDIMPWMARGWTAVLRDPSTCVVYLVPARTDAAWFHTYALRALVDLFRGRIAFEIPEAVREALRKKAEALELALDNLLALEVGDKDPQIAATRKEIKKLEKQAENTGGNAEGSCLVVMNSEWLIEKPWEQHGIGRFGYARDAVTGRAIRLEPIQNVLPFQGTTQRAPEKNTECKWCGLEGASMWSAIFDAFVHPDCRTEAVAQLEAMSKEERRKVELFMRGAQEAGA